MTSSQCNFEYLEENYPQLSDLLSSVSSLLKADELTTNAGLVDFRMTYQGKVISSAFFSESSAKFSAAFQSSKNIRSQRLCVDDGLDPSSSTASTIIGSSTFNLLTKLPILSSTRADYLNSLDPQLRDYLLLGFSSLPSLFQYLQSEECQQLPVSITIAESNPEYLACILYDFNFSAFVDFVKSKSISFNIIIAFDYVSLQERIFDYFVKQMPTALHGLKIIKSTFISAPLIKLQGWLNSQSGIGYRYLGSLGYATDEINQLIQGFVNMSHPHYMLSRPAIVPEIDTCLITASGPSLDDNLSNISKLSNSVPVIAAGSSISTLLRNNIIPNYAICAERDPSMYDLYLKLADECPELRTIPLISAINNDPRLTTLFNEISFYHRPHSSLAQLFKQQIQYALPIGGPESVNAAIETALKLGYTNIILVGADFGSPSKEKIRSKQALPDAPRAMDLPMAGNIGKTIYSQPSLIASRDAAESILEIYPDTKLYRLGVGLPIKNEIIIDDSFSLPTLRKKEAMEIDVNSVIQRSFVRLDPEPDELILLVDNLILANKAFKADIIDSIENTTVWCAQTHKDFSSMLDVLSSENSSFTNSLKQIYRSLLFFSTPSLYDSSDFLSDSKLFLSGITSVAAIVEDIFISLKIYLNDNKDSEIDVLVNWITDLKSISH